MARLVREERQQRDDDACVVQPRRPKLKGKRSGRGPTAKQVAEAAEETADARSLAMHGGLARGLTRGQVLDLDALARLPVPLPRIARRAVGVHETTLSNWRKDPAFAECERNAREQSTELAIADAAVAAIDGRTKGIYQLGRLIGYEKVHSEKLHIELLRAFAPDKFARNEVKFNVSHNTVVLASPEQVRDAVARLSPVRDVDATAVPAPLPEAKP